MNNGDLSNGIWSVDGLVNKTFVVGKYQRGYKWTSKEITKLLEDVQKFDAKKDGDFYCLQPIVVARYDANGDRWELVDGQQRMTTIFLILTYLEKGSYRIEYRTRKSSERFLQSFADGAGKTLVKMHADWQAYLHARHAQGRPDAAREIDNIDNYHFFAACKVIAGWLDALDPRARETFENKLLTQTGIIWYEARGDDHRKTFLNLNSGKIPLSPAELIRALFLKSGAGTGGMVKAHVRRVEIAREWDAIEYALRGDEFWYFLTNHGRGKEHDTRIDFIFDLRPWETEGVGNGLSSYEQYAGLKLDDEQIARAEWKKIRNCFLTIQEWFEDRVLYHHIGFLIVSGVQIGELYRLATSASRTKKEFLSLVQGRVREALRKALSDRSLGSLSYAEQSHHHGIRLLLLLFNLASLREADSHTRFPFDRYKREEWSLEHIHARKSKKLSKDEQWLHWVSWASSQLAQVTGDEAESLVAELQQSLQVKEDAEQTDKQREELEHRTIRLLDPGSAESVDGLENLALLSVDLNASLNNNLFQEKRKRIIEWDKTGRFIPVATRNVFLKYYDPASKHPNRWTTDDRKAYVKAIRTALAGYLPEIK